MNADKRKSEVLIRDSLSFFPPSALICVYLRILFFPNHDREGAAALSDPVRLKTASVLLTRGLGMVGVLIDRPAP